MQPHMKLRHKIAWSPPPAFISGHMGQIISISAFLLPGPCPSFTLKIPVPIPRPRLAFTLKIPVPLLRHPVFY